MRPEKSSIVDDLSAKLNASPFLFVTDYTGLKVDQFSELRNRLAEAGAKVHVVKNTFLRRAVSDAGLPDVGDVLTGQTAIVTGESDVAAAAKVVKVFAKEFKQPTVKAGIIDNALVSAAQVDAIADLPSREILLATFLGVLQAPASKLVRTLNEPGASLARLLQAKIEAGSGFPAAPAVEEPPAVAEAPAVTEVAEAAEAVKSPEAAESPEVA